LNGKVIAVSLSADHSFSKIQKNEIRLLSGIGVEGDAHSGRTVKHRSRVAKDPTQANLRQVHLIHSELFGELHAAGYSVTASDLGENITTEGIDLLGLPTDTLLYIGGSAVVRITGLRNPCAQIDDFLPGLLKQVVGYDHKGNLVRKAGVMGVVLESGWVRPGDFIRTQYPDPPFRTLERV
jgi:MOSC domain-containing protein YiiM